MFVNDKNIPSKGFTTKDHYTISTSLSTLKSKFNISVYSPDSTYNPINFQINPDTFIPAVTGLESQLGPFIAYRKGIMITEPVRLLIDWETADQMVEFFQSVLLVNGAESDF